MEALMVRQNLRLVVAGPVRVRGRAPLPVEGQVVVRRIRCVADGRTAAAGNIGVYRHGLAVEEDLVKEIARIESRDPAPIRLIRRVEAGRRSRRGGWIENQKTIRKRICLPVQHKAYSGVLDRSHGTGRNTARRPDVHVNPDYVVGALSVELVPRDTATANLCAGGWNRANVGRTAAQWSHCHAIDNDGDDRLSAFQIRCTANCATSSQSRESSRSRHGHGFRSSFESDAAGHVYRRTTVTSDRKIVVNRICSAHGQILGDRC